MKETEARKLIAKFMEGKTSVDEEQALEEYFKSETDVPADLKPYAEMFGYFAAGMPEDEELLKPQTEPKRQSLHIGRWIAGAAAVAALMFVVAMGTMFFGTESKVTAQGGSESNESKTIEESDTIRNEAVNIDSMLNKHPEESLPMKRRKAKFRFKPAPPETTLAQNAESIVDSIDEAARTLAQQELKRVSEEQQLTRDLIRTANAQMMEDINLMCNDDVY